MFIGISLKPTIQATLQSALKIYADQIEYIFPPEGWHTTLVWIGSDPQPQINLPALLEPLPFTFTLTMNITHIGRGKEKSQLWAYCAPSVSLQKVRQAVLDRLQTISVSVTPTVQTTFTPHVTLARLKSAFHSTSLADHSVLITVPVHFLEVLEREAVETERRYTVRGKIPLS